MKYRKSLRKEFTDGHAQLAVPKTLTELVEMTLCIKEEGKKYHRLKCIERACEECGVDKFELYPEESSDDGLVRWSRYEYVPTGKYLPDGQEKKKICLVQKETPPSQLFKYFKELLAVYSSHTFVARWQ